MERLGRNSRGLKELRRRIRHRPAGEVVLDGRKLVEDVVRWGVGLRELYLSSELASEEEVRPLREAAETVWEVAGEVLAEVAPTRHPQGVLALASEPRLVPWSMATGIGLYLEGVQDPGNVGAIVRAAAALGAEAVLLSPGCADPLHWAALRASAGAAFRVPVTASVALPSVVGDLRSAGGQVWATGAAGTPLSMWQPEPPVLLMLGSEGRGLGAAASALADHRLSITLGRDMESLNVAVAAGICLHAFRSITSPRPAP